MRNIENDNSIALPNLSHVAFGDVLERSSSCACFPPAGRALDTPHQCQLDSMLPCCLVFALTC